MMLDALEHETGPQPQRCLIILHGLGADGSDFEPVCQMLARNLADLGPLRFVLPSAPVMPIPATSTIARESFNISIPP